MNGTTLLLRSISTISVPTIGPFVAKDHFKEDRNGEAGIGWLGSNFKRYLLGKTEEAVPETTLRIHQLVKGSVDGPITAELGAEQIVETTLGQMFEMMKKQAHGEEGDLLVNGNAIIFYIRDINGQLWAVYCRWDSDYRYWYVEARSVAYPRAWRDGRRVISRDSLGL